MIFCGNFNSWNNKFFVTVRINEEDCSIKEKEQKVSQNEKAIKRQKQN